MLGAHRAGPGIVEVGDELREQLLGALELVAEGAADHQVVGEGLIERDHDAPPGQGRAIWRSASRSTLA